MSKSILLAPNIRGFCSPQRKKTSISEDGADVSDSQIEAIRCAILAECEKKMITELESDRKKYAELWQVLEKSVSQFQAELEKIISEQIIDMAIRVSEIIVRSRLPDRDMVRDVIRDTLEPLPDLQGVRVRMSPDEAKSMIALRESAGSREICDAVEVVSDASLASGDVLIESRNGYFNAQIDERLKILQQRLKERNKNAHSDNT